MGNGVLEDAAIARQRGPGDVDFRAGGLEFLGDEAAGRACPMERGVN